MSSEEESEEWMPSEPKSKAPRKPPVTKAKEAKTLKMPKEPKPKAQRKPLLKRKLGTNKATLNPVPSGLNETKRAKMDIKQSTVNARTTADCHRDEESDEPGPLIMKQEVRHTFKHTSNKHINEKHSF